MCKVYPSLSLKRLLSSLYNVCVYVCVCTCFFTIFVSVEPVIIQSADAQTVFVVICFLLATSSISCLRNFHDTTPHLYSLSSLSRPITFIRWGIHLLHFPCNLLIWDQDLLLDDALYKTHNVCLLLHASIELLKLL